MGEFASKGVAGSGLGLGIAGLATALLQGSNNGNGILGGIFGGNNSQVSALMAENANLRAEKYSDNQDATLYQATRSENKTLREELFNYITPIANEAASNRERVAVIEANVAKNAEIAELREKLVRSELGAQISNVAQASGNGIAQLNNAVAALQNTVASITSTVVPKSAICPEVMARYNSWTAPTTTTTESGS